MMLSTSVSASTQRSQLAGGSLALSERLAAEVVDGPVDLP